MQGPNFRWRIIRAFIVLALVAIGSSTAAHAWTETVLHSFASGSDGGFPVTNLIADQAGNFYGTTEFGGGACRKSRGCGTVFKRAPDGTETVLYAFHNSKDGGWPLSGLVLDSQGNLYGTTIKGGKGPCGTVFQVTQQGVETVVYSFQCGADGDHPVAGLVSDQDGNLYGTTSSGGTSNCFCGTVFEVTTTGVHTVLYSFQGTLNGATDGDGPQAPLIFDADGNLYGTTAAGGSSHCGGGGCRTVFALAPDGTETVLYAFKGGHDGWGPTAGLIFDAAGNLYSTTAIGGGDGCEGNGCGTVFELAADGTESVLSTFNRVGGPAQPFGGVILDSKGNLFGTTLYGGTSGCYGGGCGTVFKLEHGAKAKAIYLFGTGKDGANPAAGLLQDTNGNLYGTTETGGQGGWGTVFALKK